MCHQGLQQKRRGIKSQPQVSWWGRGEGGGILPNLTFTPWDLYTALSMVSCTLNNHPGLVYVPGWPLGMLGLPTPYLK